MKSLSNNLGLPLCAACRVYTRSNRVDKHTGSRARLQGSNPVQSFLAGQPWANNLKCLCLNLLICKMGLTESLPARILVKIK